MALKPLLIWRILPTELKSIESLHEFKRKVKEWNGKKPRLPIMQNIYQKFRIFRMNINVDTGSIPKFTKHVSNFSCFSKEFPRFIFVFFEKGGNVIVSTEGMQPKYCCTLA